MIMCVDDLSKAIQNLRDGSLVVYPTDTLYAMGADVFNKNAVEKVFKVKKRPFSVPLPVAVSDFEAMKDIAVVDDTVKCLVDFFLPGALTLLLKKKSCISDRLTSGSDKVAVRIPDNDIALRLLSDFGPITVTSANIHGDKTLGVINDIKMQFKSGDVAVYLDYGRLEDKASTIVDVSAGSVDIIREGVITKKQILEVI